MKRLVTVLALLMLLFAFLGGQAFTADINDGLVEDNHPWEDEEDGNGQGYCNHEVGGISDFTATGYFPLEILVNSDLLLFDFREFLLNSSKADTKLSGSDKRDLYLDRTKQASFR